MTGAAECYIALTKFWDGVASFDERASLDFFLLALLQSEGVDGIADLLNGYPEGVLEGVTKADTGPGVFFTVSRPGSPRLTIEASVDDDLAFVDVTVETPVEAPAAADPKHVAFYATWERLIEAGSSVPDPRDRADRAVFLIASMEADVMNGGLGQYLTNTEGVHLTETLECLERIGAPATRDVLSRAAELGARAESYAAAWDDDSDAFSRLDDEFLDTGEDLAALTATAFLGA